MWPCISGVHDKIFMKFGHQIGCRDTEYLKNNSNDIDTTYNDLEMTFNSVFSIFDLENPRWAALGGHLGFQKLAISLQRKQISGWSFFKTLSACLALISYVIVILVGRKCLAVEEKMHVNFDLQKKNSFLYFLQMYSIVPCSKSYESRFFIFTQFLGENVIERGKEGHAEEKMISNDISRSSKANEGQLVLLIFFHPISYHLAKNDENMNILHKDMPIYAHSDKAR